MSDETPKKIQYHSTNPPTEVADRLTYSLSVHFEQHERQPHSVVMSGDRQLGDIEQAYVRFFDADESPIPLDTGWIKNPGCIVIQNRTGTRPRVNLSEEQKKDIEARILQISIVDEPFCLVRPGQCAFFELTDASKISIVSLYKSADVALFVFSR